MCKKPLSKGFWVQGKDKDAIWVEVKCERLGIFVLSVAAWTILTNIVIFWKVEGKICLVQT